MAPHQERVAAEREEVFTRLVKLRAFIDMGTEPLAPNTFDGLSPEEKDRLIRQRCIMAEYVDVLDERIDAFKLTNARGR